MKTSSLDVKTRETFDMSTYNQTVAHKDDPKYRAIEALMRREIVKKRALSNKHMRRIAKKPLTATMLGCRVN